MVRELALIKSLLRLITINLDSRPCLPRLLIRLLLSSLLFLHSRFLFFYLTIALLSFALSFLHFGFLLALRFLLVFALLGLGLSLLAPLLGFSLLLCLFACHLLVSKIFAVRCSNVWIICIVMGPLIELLFFIFVFFGGIAIISVLVSATQIRVLGIVDHFWLIVFSRLVN